MSKIIDENGFWLIENNPISKEGVFPYLGKTISPELEPNKIYNVYRPFEELSNVETVKSFNAVPFINNHEMIGDGFTPYDERTADGVLVNVKAENARIKDKIFFNIICLRFFMAALPLRFIISQCFSEIKRFI